MTPRSSSNHLVVLPSRSVLNSTLKRKREGCSESHALSSTDLREKQSPLQLTSCALQWACVFLWRLMERVSAGKREGSATTGTSENMFLKWSESMSFSLRS